MLSIDFPEGFRAAVELRGIHLGASRQPLTDGQRGDRGALAKNLKRILADLSCT